MIGPGVPAGAIRPYQAVASKPGNPVSARVGSSGIADVRFGDVTASARSLPLCICGSTTAVLGNAMVMRPASRSGSSAGLPR